MNKAVTLFLEQEEYDLFPTEYCDEYRYPITKIKSLNKRISRLEILADELTRENILLSVGVPIPKYK